MYPQIYLLLIKLNNTKWKINKIIIFPFNGILLDSCILESYLITWNWFDETLKNKMCV